MDKRWYSDEQVKFAKQFKKLGFELGMTGGGCTAIIKRTESTEIYLTVENDSIAPTSWEDVELGAYLIESCEAIIGPVKVISLEQVKKLISFERVSWCIFTKGG